MEKIILKINQLKGEYNNNVNVNKINQVIDKFNELVSKVVNDDLYIDTYYNGLSKVSYIELIESFRELLSKKIAIKIKLQNSFFTTDFEKMNFDELSLLENETNWMIELLEIN